MTTSQAYRLRQVARPGARGVRSMSRAGKARQRPTQSLRSMLSDGSQQGKATAVSTARFALLVFAIASVFTLYIGHVYATQDLVNELQQARGENLRLHLQHNRLTGALDEATGPLVIHRRAEALGLGYGFTYGPSVSVQPPAAAQ